MNYKATLTTGEQVYIGLKDSQTRIQLQSGDEGHNESQGTSFETGEWKQPPSLYKTSKGAVLKIECEQDTIYIQLEKDSINHLEAAPQLENADKVKLEETDDFPASEPIKPMAPMKPMEPLKPMNGNGSY